MKTTSKIIIWGFIIVMGLSIFKEFSPNSFEYFSLDDIRFYATFILCVTVVFGGIVDKRKNEISKIESEDFKNE